MMKINIDNLELLINGSRLPDSKAEELFLMSYKCGLGDELLLFTLLELKDIFEALSGEEKDYFILGYCLGQKHFRDIQENGIENYINNKPGVIQ